MDGETYERRLRECEVVIESLPTGQRGQLLEMLEETKARQIQIENSIAKALSVLDDWRIERKYQLFDREARMREEGAS